MLGMQGVCVCAEHSCKLLGLERQCVALINLFSALSSLQDSQFNRHHLSAILALPGLQLSWPQALPHHWVLRAWWRHRFSYASVARHGLFMLRTGHNCHNCKHMALPGCDRHIICNSACHNLEKNLNQPSQTGLEPADRGPPPKDNNYKTLKVR